MWRSRNRFFAILSAILILMAGFGTAVVAADTAGDNSTIVSEEYSIEETNIDYEETNTEEETTVLVNDADDVITSGGSVIYEEDNTEITDIDTRTDIDNTYISDDDYNYTSSDDDNISADNNSTVYKDTTIITENKSIIDNSENNYINTEITQVNLDDSKTVKVDVKNENSVVNNVYFVSTADSGKTNVVVEDLKDEGLTEKPAGVVYKSFNIFIENTEAANNIDNAAVDFKVEKSWLVANGLDESAIVLNMYENGKWKEVPITITSEDSQYIYFKAEVDEYSTFAITSNTVIVDKILKQSESQEQSESQGNISSEEIDGPTKNVIIKLLEFVIELLKGE